MAEARKDPRFPPAPENHRRDDPAPSFFVGDIKFGVFQQYLHIAI